MLTNLNIKYLRVNCLFLDTTTMKILQVKLNLLILPLLYSNTSVEQFEYGCGRSCSSGSCHYSFDWCSCCLL